MIAGLGTDIVNIERIEQALSRFGERFIAKSFTSKERADLLPCGGDGRRLACKAAKLFAAKEAAVKALGTGFNQGISWQEVEIGHDPLGKPLLALTGRAAERADFICGGKGYRVLVSLSDDYPLAQAVVIIESL